MLNKGLHPKQEIAKISNQLLKAYHDKNLIDKYDVYQHLMDYWLETMQDDMYELAADGWKAGNEVTRLEKNVKKGGKDIVRQVAGIEGLEGRLIPPDLIIQEYFADGQKAIENLQTEAESLNAQMDEMREEHGGEDGLLANAIDDKGKISKTNLQKAIKELGKRDTDNAEEFDKLQEYFKLMEDEAAIKADIKQRTAELEILIIKKYPTLTLDEIKTIVVDKKWLFKIEQSIRTELDDISHRLTARIKELAERYETPLPQLSEQVDELTARVENHLKQMGVTWK